ncbi:unnamed protein product [Orchesella dallaii]|uniref:EB domain-containing protein n=1 Tax=Orchesella dallaii TaxID=48710 RepID=A0ABP1Q6S7_9HEXA
MEFHHILYLTVLLCLVNYGSTDGQKDHGETCSLKSQIANFFRENDSAEGCISAKGLVCVNHKCVCADPSNVYEVVTPDNGMPSASDVASQASNFLKNLVKISTTTTPPSTTVAGVAGGKCVGRAGSPCFTATSTCVKHASCEGNPKLCKCQGIYSSNAMGYCSKTASVVQQVIKQTVG